MSSSKRARIRMMKSPPESSWQPDLKRPSLVIGWSVDASALGAKATDYLIAKLSGRSFFEIEPVEFFPLGGVSVENDLVQFPGSTFYACPEYDLMVLKSSAPSYEWHKFLNLILDVAEYYRVQELYAIGGMVSLSAHTAPRELVGTFNSTELKEALSGYNLGGGLDYETPPGQRPTLNSFLLWTAKRRNIPAASLWLPVPFYLLTMDDPATQRRVLEFFNQRFNLSLDFSDLDVEIGQQNQALAGMRDRFPDIDESIKRLEGNLRLSPEEARKLVKEVEAVLREVRG